MKLINSYLCKSACAFALLFLAAHVSAKKGDKDVTPYKDASVDSVAAEDYGMSAGMEEVVITGQYAPATVDKVVHKIRVIDRKKIDAMSAQNLKDVLSNEMNVRLSQDNVLGSSMSLQGISGENVKILVDGVPVIGRQNGSIDLSQINLNNIERIEIIEGPMSVTYGTNALAGTINLISKKDLQNKWTGQLATYYETIGTYNANARLGYAHGDHAITLSGGRNYFDGWKDGEKIALDNKAVPADDNRYQQWKPREQLFGELQYSYKLKKTTFTYKGSYFKEEITNKGMPNGPYGEDALDDKYLTWRRDNAVYIAAPLAGGKAINFQLAYNDYRRVKNTYYRDLTTLSSELVGGEGLQDTSRFNLLNSRATFSNNKYHSKVNYEIGYDINLEHATGLRIKDNGKQIGDYAVFSSMEYKPVEGLVLRPGVRFTYNTIYKAPLIPSMNIKYAIGHTGVSVRAAYAKGFRSPTLKELFFYFYDVNHNIRGNEQLQAESSDNINMDISFTKNRDRNSLKTSIGGYFNNIKNLITLAQASDNPIDYTYVNVGKYKTLGMQASAELKVNTLTLAAGALYTGRYNRLYEDGAGNQFVYSPELRGNVMYEFAKLNMMAALFYKYTGSMPGYAVDEDGNVLQTSISDYQVADATLSKALFSKKLVIGIGCKNLFDVKNVNASAAGASGEPHAGSATSMAISTGRNFFVKMDVNLNSK